MQKIATHSFSPALLQQMFDQASDVLLVLDMQGRLLEINQTACDVLGYTRQALLQKNIRELVETTQAPDIGQRLDRIRQHGYETFEVSYLHQSGRLIPFEVHSRQIKVVDGEYILHACRDITLRKHSERMYRYIIRASGEGFFALSAVDARFIDANETYCAMLGYTRNELLRLHVYDVEILESRDDVLARIQNIVQTGYQLFETRQLHKNGQPLELEISVSYAPVDQGVLFVFARDISQRKRQEADHRLAAMIFNTSTSSIVVTDEYNNIISVNPAFTEITGYEAHEVKGLNPRFLQSGRNGKAFYQHMWEQLLEKGHWEGEWWNRNKLGEEFAEQVSLNLIRHPDGSIYRYIKISSDITQKKRLDDIIWRQAHYDVVTQLPNRQLFLTQLRHELELCGERGQMLALYFIDLDGFKQINDSYGHDAGDELLHLCGQRIAGCFRASDLVARLGGDEFTAMVSGLPNLARADLVGRKIMQQLALPFSLSEATVRISASIGIAVFPQDADNVTDLMRQADQAMYAAKQAGKNTLRFAGAYSPDS